MTKFNPIKNKVVYLIFQSQALGDTLAWFPYVEQFRIEKECRVKVFLPKQELIPLLKPNYPDIEFLNEDCIEVFDDGDTRSLCFMLQMSAE